KIDQAVHDPAIDPGEHGSRDPHRPDDEGVVELIEVKLVVGEAIGCEEAADDQRQGQNEGDEAQEIAGERYKPAEMSLAEKIRGMSNPADTLELGYPWRVCEAIGAFQVPQPPQDAGFAGAAHVEKHRQADASEGGERTVAGNIEMKLRSSLRIGDGAE